MYPFGKSVTVPDLAENRMQRISRQILFLYQSISLKAQNPINQPKKFGAAVRGGGGGG